MFLQPVRRKQAKNEGSNSVRVSKQKEPVIRRMFKALFLNSEKHKVEDLKSRIEPVISNPFVAVSSQKAAKKSIPRQPSPSPDFTPLRMATSRKTAHNISSKFGIRKEPCGLETGSMPKERETVEDPPDGAMFAGMEPHGER